MTKSAWSLSRRRGGGDARSLQPGAAFKDVHTRGAPIHYQRRALYVVHTHVNPLFAIESRERGATITHLASRGENVS